MVLLLFIGALSARPPEIEQSKALIEDLIDAVINDRVSSSSVYTWFSEPNREFIEIDRFRLEMTLGAQGALGKVLRERPGIAGVVSGPDYQRIILGTAPYLSFVVTRVGASPIISHWEVTSCSDCKEPERFVSDLIVKAKQGGSPSLLEPGLDLWINPEGPDLNQGLDPGEWRRAFQRKMLASGYLRWLLADAEVLGSNVDGVRVSLGDKVESWPIVYLDGNWMLDYHGLPNDSVLRIKNPKIWRSTELAREKAFLWWLPYSRSVDRGEIWAEWAVGVSWQPIQERWLIHVQRPDSALCGLFFLEKDGTVVDRVQVEPWPEQIGASIERWLDLWVSEISPDGKYLVYSASSRWWIIELETGKQKVGQRGVLGNIVNASWTPNSKYIALGDDLGNIGLVNLNSDFEQLRYGRGTNSQVTGLQFANNEKLVVGWANGRLQIMTGPTLEEGKIQETCKVRDLELSPLYEKLYVSCRNQVQEYSLDLKEISSFEAKIVDVSPDGMWTIQSANTENILVRSIDQQPLAGFGHIPIVEVAWSNNSQDFLVLQADGRVVHYSIKDLLN